MRLFIAIELSPDLRRPLIDLIHKGRGGSRDLRWSNESQLHLTLKFLGEFDPARLDDVKSIVREVSAATPRFSLTLNGVGGFPNPRSPRVLWAGVADQTQSCRAWLAAADPRFAALGVELERRPFSPHITLARSNAPGGNDAIADILRARPVVPALSMPVTEVILFQSELLPGGAKHTPLLHAPVDSSTG